MAKKYIRFDWAAKKMLRDKKNFHPKDVAHIASYCLTQEAYYYLKRKISFCLDCRELNLS